jgi:hypothetical protein
MKKWSTLPLTAQVAIIIWGPLLVYIGCYGGAFAVAKHAEQRYDASLDNCRTTNTSGFPCYVPQQEGIEHGLLWLPQFKVNGSASSGKY